MANEQNQGGNQDYSGQFEQSNQGQGQNRGQQGGSGEQGFGQQAQQDQLGGQSGGIADQLSQSGGQQGQQGGGQQQSGQQQQFDAQQGGDFASQIREHQEVIDAQGNHVGTVDHVQGDQIKLARNDSDDGQHHYVQLSQVAGIEGGQVRLRERGDNDFGQEA